MHTLRRIVKCYNTHAMLKRVCLTYPTVVNGATPAPWYQGSRWSRPNQSHVSIYSTTVTEVSFLTSKKRNYRRFHKTSSHKILTHHHEKYMTISAYIQFRNFDRSWIRSFVAVHPFFRTSLKTPSNSNSHASGSFTKTHQHRNGIVTICNRPIVLLSVWRKKIALHQPLTRIIQAIMGNYVYERTATWNWWCRSAFRSFDYRCANA